MLVASMNPRSCGYYNHPERECECLPGDVQRYLSRISGPLLDRIDIHIEVTLVPFQDMSGMQPAEPSRVIRERVMAARKIQSERYGSSAGIHNNSQMSPSLMHRYCRPDAAGASLIKNAMERLGLSARAYDRILRVARTIADLEGSSNVHSQHLAEAVNYRSLDRRNWE
jgi:magnesium chelatase family protein